MALSVHPFHHRRDVPGRLESAARADRSRHGGHSRQPHRGRSDGRQSGVDQVPHLRRERAVCRCGRCAGCHRGAVRGAGQFHHRPVHQLHRRRRHRRHRVHRRRHLRGHLHPVRAEHCRPDFQGRPLGDLRNISPRLRLSHARRRGRGGPTADGLDAKSRATKTDSRPVSTTYRGRHET